MATIYEAWSLAEEAAVVCFETTLADLGLTIEVGDNLEKLDQINTLLFSIGSNQSGTIVQSHQHQTGAGVWHSQAAAIGLFESRELAMKVATLIMTAVPYASSPHLVRLYLIDHPIIETVEIQQTNTQVIIWGWQLKINFGAVYKCET